MNYLKLKEAVLDAVERGDSEAIISPFDFDKSRENEFIFFYKPDCFLDNSREQMGKLLEMTFEQFSRFQVKVSGVLLLDGKRLDELSTMDLHYGFINKLSKEASQLVAKEELEAIRVSLGLETLEEHIILGGHECLKQFPALEIEPLTTLWDSKKSFRLRSGFYYQDYEIEGKKVILINGFHPLQLVRFTNPRHRILVLLLHSDTDWSILKNDLSGGTFPEKANAESIRGVLYRNNEEYGLPEVSISHNCIHLSAGPFEALFEIDNFFKRIDGIDYKLENTNIARLMENPCPEVLVHCLNNAVAVIDGEETDLDTRTEEKNSLPSIADYREHFNPPC
ncbi:MAG: nucleoside-diphosphate kinase [bacterium]|nr:nucleoside-diphosphate kinase [bacterium]